MEAIEEDDVDYEEFARIQWSCPILTFGAWEQPCLIMHWYLDEEVDLESALGFRTRLYPSKGN